MATSDWFVVDAGCMDGILSFVNRVVVARSAHEIPDRVPIRVEIGDRVKVGERDSEWPAFVFITAQKGSGWVPERHLEREGVGAVVRHRYDTTELPTEEGEQLEVLCEDLRSGWLWCRAQSGREGWVPERTLAPFE
jgi:SH3 domain